MARVQITEFGVIQKLLSGATVAVYDARDNGESTGDLATLYAADTGATQVSNPQVLDDNGKLSVPCYVSGRVVAEISNISDLSDRSLRKIRANPTQFPLGATNAAYEGATVVGSVAEAESHATDAAESLSLIEETFSGVSSTTSLSISIGTKVFTIEAGLPFGAGQYVIATSNANPTTHSMNGQITSYSGTLLTIEVDSVLGSGARADWTIRNSGPRGAPGATGPAGSGAGDMLKSENLSGLVDYAEARNNLGLGTAAESSSADFATAAQGELAETSLQDDDKTSANGMTKVLLATYSPSLVGSVDITSIISSTYDTYDIEITHIIPVMDGAAFQILTSSNNGSTWDASSGDYIYATGNAPSSGSGMNNDGSSSAAFMQPINNTGNATGEFISGNLQLLGANSTTKYKTISWDLLFCTSSGVFYRGVGGGMRKSNSAVNAIQLKFGSGNISSGTVRVYGNRKA